MTGGDQVSSGNPISGDHLAPRIAVVFYSATGNVAAMAEALAEGAAKEGAQVRVRPVAELAPAEAIDRNLRWRAWVEDNPYDETATLADLEWADGIALGSPTRFGGPAGQLKEFLDTTGGLWMQGKLVDKLGTAFTSASTRHGGLESTILAINNIFYHWGSIVVPLGYTDPHLMESGNPYGGSFVSRKSAAPDDEALQACRLQGVRLTQVTRRLVGTPT
ncbi:flavoprotein WrbA (plasmid) [Pseudonocardia dioxanivorans CB1190]|uniref:Flavoprotein WrbA n=1 Tax=Pseudonocardia dioxanivorans (strain ATCC 55486 / DSM 44775 / JCM 13855 / CB1190) TaxID=675635 RepID=F2L6U4_PSEUX|nr:flavoprotein WrbA [Pseudonocardia dioxanivorans CB1190]